MVAELIRTDKPLFKKRGDLVREDERIAKIFFSGMGVINHLFPKFVRLFGKPAGFGPIGVDVDNVVTLPRVKGILHPCGFKRPHLVLDRPA